MSISKLFSKIAISIFLLLCLFVLLIIEFLFYSLQYSKKDFDFTNAELQHFASFKPGQTIYFEDERQYADSMIVLKIDPFKKEQAGALMALPAENRLVVMVKYPGHYAANDNSWFFCLSKRPQSAQVNYIIAYGDHDTMYFEDFGELHKDIVVLNKRRISNYYLIKDRIGSDQREIYWTDDEGMVAFKDTGDHTWVKTNKKDGDNTAN